LEKKKDSFIIIIITSCFKHFCHVLNLLSKKWMLALYDDEHGTNAAELHIHLLVSFFYVCHSDHTSFRNVFASLMLVSWL